MGDATFKPNWAAWRAMANGPEAKAMVTEAAEKAKGIAEGLAEEIKDDENGKKA